MLMLNISKFLLFFYCFLSVTVTSVYATKPVLVFFNWSDYCHPAIISSFEKEYSVTVHEVNYQTDELKEEMLLANEGKGFDVMIGSGITMTQYVKHKWIQELQFQKIPNSCHIHPSFNQKYPSLKNFAIPYLWGTLGIGYRKDKINYKVTSWRDLFMPQAILRDRIYMIDDSKDVIAAALIISGYSINTKDLSHYKQIFNMLKFQRGFVKKFGYIDISDQSPMLSGEIWMAMMYNGDALVLKEKSSNIEFCVPKEGTNLWIDYLAIMAGSKQKELAHAFINYILYPQNAAAISRYLKYATPNKTARSYLPKSHLENTTIYPPEEILNKSEVYSQLPPAIIKKRNSIFINVVHGK